MDKGRVAAAVAALSAFGGDLDRQQANRLLSMWAGRRTLSAAEVWAVLRRYPMPKAEHDSPAGTA